MSINQTFAMDQKKVKGYGKLFGTIDFEAKKGVTKGNFNLTQRGVVVGTLFIGNKEFPITLAELQRLGETTKLANELISKKYRLGLD